VNILGICSISYLSFLTMEVPSLTASDPSTHIVHTSFPDDIKLRIAQELYNDGVLLDNTENTADLVSLSMSSKSWRFASLPCE